MTADRDLPSVTIVIPTYNANRYVNACLRSIFRQEYPPSLLRVLVVDGGSTDDTLKTARSYNVETLHNELRDAEIGKMTGFRRSSSDLFIYLDADIELACDDWFKRMVFPLREDPSIAGSFTRFLPKKGDPPLNRYLAYHKLMLDPVMRHFCPSIESTVVESRCGYQICAFKPWKTPPAGVQLYRLDVLKRVVSDDDYRWWDIDIPVRLAKRGYNKFAYVEAAGLYHLTVKGIRDLMAKKKWMINESFLPHIQKREYQYINFSNRKNIFKLLAWVLYANSLFPAFIKGFVQSIENKDLACMYDPLITAFLTDYYLYGFLRSDKGRNFLRQISRSSTCV